MCSCNLHYTLRPGISGQNFPNPNWGGINSFTCSGIAQTMTVAVNLAPTVVPVTIDIKPGSDPNSINLCTGGNVTVAVLTTDDFDATTIDPDTATLADADVRMAGKSGKLMAHEEDVDGDGDVDLVMQFATVNLAMLLGSVDTTATLHAMTIGGQAVEGTDFVNIVKDCS